MGKHYSVGSKRLSVFVCLLFAAVCGCGTISPQPHGLPGPGLLAISGVVIDYSTKQPIGGALVFLEQVDAGGVDRPVAKTTTGADGTFQFNGLQAASYEIVTNASVPSSGGAISTYATTMTLNVPVATNVGQIPLFPEYGAGFPTGVPVTIMGVVSSGSGSSTAVPVDVTLSALQGTLSTSTQGKFTIPVFTGSTERVTTAGGTAFCTNGMACVTYQLLVPGSMPSMGTYSPTGTNYSIPSQDPVEVLYVFEGKAFAPGSSTPDCAPPTQLAAPIVPLGTLVSANPSIAFTSCQ